MSLRTPLYPHPHVSWFRQSLNLIGCILIVPLYRAAAVNTWYPATVDLLISILLAEFCRFNNESRRIAYRDAEAQLRYKDDIEKNALKVADQPGGATCETLAAVVGWREDPNLWERCLESYKTARRCKFLLAGIDGNESDDLEMVDIFKQVRKLHELAALFVTSTSMVAHGDSRIREVLTHHVRCRYTQSSLRS